MIVFNVHVYRGVEVIQLLLTKHWENFIMYERERDHLICGSSWTGLWNLILIRLHRYFIRWQIHTGYYLKITFKIPSRILIKWAHSFVITIEQSWRFLSHMNCIVQRLAPLTPFLTTTISSQVATLHSYAGKFICSTNRNRIVHYKSVLHLLVRINYQNDPIVHVLNDGRYSISVTNLPLFSGSESMSSSPESTCGEFWEGEWHVSLWMLRS